MKLRTLFLILITISSCNTNENSNIKEKIACTLEDKTEDAFSALYNYYDFTIKNVTETGFDKEGTKWTNNISDEFRFVFNNRKGFATSRDGDLLVYKNNALIKKYMNVHFGGTIKTNVDQSNCSYELYSNYELSYKSGDHEIINIFGSTSNYYANYYSPNKTIYQGNFNQFNY